MYYGTATLTGGRSREGARSAAVYYCHGFFVPVRVFVEDSVAEEDALAVAAHEAATAGWPPHGHIRTQSEFQAVFASVAEHLLTPPSIMALFGNDVMHRTGDLRSITVGRLGGW